MGPLLLCCLSISLEAVTLCRPPIWDWGAHGVAWWCKTGCSVLSNRLQIFVHDGCHRLAIVYQVCIRGRSLGGSAVVHTVLSYKDFRGWSDCVGAY